MRRCATPTPLPLQALDFAPLPPPNPTQTLTQTRAHPAARSDKCYISTGYDPTTHFETTIDDVLDLYRRITGEVPNLDAKNARVAEAAAAAQE